jgi:hypothetical protein
LESLVLVGLAHDIVNVPHSIISIHMVSSLHRTDMTNTINETWVLVQQLKIEILTYFFESKDNTGSWEACSKGSSPDLASSPEGNSSHLYGFFSLSRAPTAFPTIMFTRNPGVQILLTLRKTRRLRQRMLQLRQRRLLKTRLPKLEMSQAPRLVRQGAMWARAHSKRRMQQLRWLRMVGNRLEIKIFWI